MTSTSLPRDTNSIDNTGGRPAAALCILNTIAIAWQACAGHALDFDWLYHWLFPESESSRLSWHPDLANWPAKSDSLIPMAYMGGIIGPTMHQLLESMS